jgi:hypothetical protein
VYPIKTWMNAISTRAQVLNSRNVAHAMFQTAVPSFPGFVAWNKNWKGNFRAASNYRTFVAFPVSYSSTQIRELVKA